MVHFKVIFLYFEPILNSLISELWQITYSGICLYRTFSESFFDIAIVDAILGDISVCMHVYVLILIVPLWTENYIFIKKIENSFQNKSTSSLFKYSSTCNTKFEYFIF